MESESDLRRLEEINKDKEEDEKKTQELKEAFARIANTKNREELSSPKLNYKSKVQYNRINQVLLNSENRGSWEYDVKQFVGSCDGETQSKLVCGNYIDIRIMRRNMKNNEHAQMLKEDWKFIATLLAFDSLKEKDSLSLEECLEVATRRRSNGSRYNLDGDDGRRLLNYEPGKKEKSQIEDKPQKQKRKRGVISQSKTIEALSKAVEENIQLKVKGRNMRTTTADNVKRQKISYSTIWRNHCQSSDYIVMEVLEMDSTLKFYRLKKTPTDLLKARLMGMLTVSKDEAREQILKRRSKDSQVKKPVTEEKLKDEMRKKKTKMARSTCWKQCMFCFVYAEVETVILESSARAHYRLYHEGKNTAGEEPLAFPIVQILEKD